MAQNPGGEKYRVYRKFGAPETNLQLNKDKTYALWISFYNCSLCDDYHSIATDVERKGKWYDQGDTLILQEELAKQEWKLLRINTDELNPLFIIEKSLDSLTRTERKKQALEMQQHYFVINTRYTNGQEETIERDLEGRKHGLVTRYDSTGRLMSKQKFKKGKLNKTIK